jgi:DNA-binding CsgD family transcriptional regulator
VGDGGVPTELGGADTLDLISRVYDAAVTPESWPGVLELCREFVGGVSAAVFAKSVTGNRRQLYHIDGRIDAFQTQVYFSTLAPIDPSNTVQVYAEVEEGVINSQKLDMEDFAQTRFAREWAAPQHIVDIGFATLERQGDWASLFGVFRHERDGLGDEAMRLRISLLAPHIGRALRIGNMIGGANQQADTFRNTIDGLAAAVLLVDAEGRLVHANHAGRTMLGAGQAVTQGREGVLRLDRQGMRAFLPQPGEVVPHSASVETASGERLVVHVLPLTGGMRTYAGLGGDAVAALFVQPARFNPPSIPQTLARAFNLTPAELRVALATLSHDRVADVAETLGVAEPTVKTHLSRVFAKTDTRRQADIVKLVAAFSSPLASK